MRVFPRVRSTSLVSLVALPGGGLLEPFGHRRVDERSDARAARPAGSPLGEPRAEGSRGFRAAALPASTLDRTRRRRDRTFPRRPPPLRHPASRPARARWRRTAQGNQPRTRSPGDRRRRRNRRRRPSRRRRRRRIESESSSSSSSSSSAASSFAHRIASVSVAPRRRLSGAPAPGRVDPRSIETHASTCAARSATSAPTGLSPPRTPRRPSRASSLRGPAPPPPARRGDRRQNMQGIARRAPSHGGVDGIARRGDHLGGGRGRVRGDRRGDGATRRQSRVRVLGFPKRRRRRAPRAPRWPRARSRQPWPRPRRRRSR